MSQRATLTSPDADGVLPITVGRLPSCPLKVDPAALQALHLACLDPHLLRYFREVVLRGRIQGIQEEVNQIIFGKRGGSVPHGVIDARPPTRPAQRPYRFRSGRVTDLL